MGFGGVMTSASRAFGSAARWLRPRNAPESASSVKPGLLAQGPEEKLGFDGRMSGVATLAIAVLPYRRKAARGGYVTRSALYVSSLSTSTYFGGSRRRRTR